MIRRHHTPEAARVAAACVLVLLMAVAAACSDRGVIEDRVATEGVATSTVVAQERTLTSVLTLDGVVVVSPFVRIAAPQDGVLVAMSKGRVGIVPTPGSAAVPVELPENTAIVSLLVKSGTRVSAGLPIINARYTGFAIQAAVPAEQVYRLYDGVKSVKAQVKVGPGPFDTSVLGVPYPPGAITLPSDGAAVASSLSVSRPGAARLVLCDASSDETDTATPATPGGADVSAPESATERSTRAAAPSSRETSTFPVVTTAPQDTKAGVVIIVQASADLKLIEGMPARVALVTAEKTGVALPIEAVAGISHKGQIYVVAAGRVELRNVTLGITDGSYVLVTDGLAAGEVVQIPSPSIVEAD